MLHAWQLEPGFLLSQGVGLLQSGKPVRRGTLACFLGLKIIRGCDSIGKEFKVRGWVNFDGGGSISSPSRPRQSEKSVQQVLQFEQGWYRLSLVWGPNCQVGLVDPFSQSISTITAKKSFHEFIQIWEPDRPWGKPILKYSITQIAIALPALQLVQTFWGISYLKKVPPNHLGKGLDPPGTKTKLTLH